MPEKEKLIQELRQLPDDVLNELYALDVIRRKGKMYCNLYLADQLKEHRVMSYNENFFRFNIGAWDLEMEIDD